MFFDSTSKAVLFVEFAAVLDGVQKAVKMAVARGMVADALVPRKPIFVRIDEAVDVAVKGRNKAHILVQHTFVFVSVFKAFEVAGGCGGVRDVRVVLAAVLGRVHKTGKVAVVRGVKSRFGVPRASVFVKVSENVETSKLGGERRVIFFQLDSHVAETDDIREIAFFDGILHCFDDIVL